MGPGSDRICGNLLWWMSDVTARLLSVLSTLQSGRPVNGTELAEPLGISSRTLRRDIDRLRSYPTPAA